MTDFMRQLQTLAQNTNITILVSSENLAPVILKGIFFLVFKVINNTARVNQTSLERKPALGPSFALMTDTTLWLTIDSENADPPCHTIKVLRSESIVRR
jgi:RAD51-like protein 3